ncbi:MAG: 16S rRNA processing protein RimM [Firmicutes bacterium]|nr:16S rRNA processing protein RimM [Bacillota bacterium]
MKKVALGRVTAPVGIKGEIRVYPYLEQARFSDIKKVVLQGEGECELQYFRANGKMLVVKLSCCSDRNTAETLRNRELYLPEGQDLDLGADTYFVDDLVGLNVRTEDGREVGTLKEVHSRSAQDLYEIEKPDGSSFLMPAVKEFVLKVDKTEGVMTVKIPEGLEDL